MYLCMHQMLCIMGIPLSEFGPGAHSMHITMVFTLHATRAVAQQRSDLVAIGEMGDKWCVDRIAATEYHVRDAIQCGEGVMQDIENPSNQSVIHFSATYDIIAC